MAASLFVEFEGRAAAPATRDDWLAALGEPLATLSGATSVELYAPEEAADPLLDDGTGPPAVAQIRFADAGAAAAAISDDFAAALDEIEMFAGGVRPRALDVVESHLYPAAGEDDPAGTAVAVAYLVHYRRPAEDEAAFIRYYLDHHPPIMAELPGIRRLEVYTPLAFSGVPRLAAADSMLICDVSFDSAATLSAALASEARLRLRADFKTFPPYSGAVTHFAMRRQRVFP